MGRINYGRVILGGLAAGVILNIGEIILNTQIVAGEWEEAMKALSKQPLGGHAMAVLVVLMLILGLLELPVAALLGAWLYREV